MDTRLRYIDRRVLHRKCGELADQVANHNVEAVLQSPPQKPSPFYELDYCLRPTHPKLMKLFHYTSVPLADTILSSSLKFGHMNLPSGLVRNVVWLTSDPSSEGHGLTTGQEKNLTESQIRHLEKVQGGPLRNHVMQDKTAIRLTYALPDDWTAIVQNFVDYCRVNEQDGELVAKMTGLSCYMDVNAADDKRLKRAFKTMKTKEKTWWISFAPIPSDLIVAVDVKTNKGYQPYAFDPHGRIGMANVGLFAPSEATLATLQPLLPGLHQFEIAKARMICTDPAQEPMVAIRGRGTERIFTIRDTRLVDGSDLKQHELEDWVRQHRDELLGCWQQAVESYHSFHPEV
jgi:hypothetical protein